MFLNFAKVKMPKISRLEKQRKLRINYKNSPSKSYKKLINQQKMIIPVGQPKYPIPIGQTLDEGRFSVEKYFNTEIYRHWFLGIYHDHDRTRWIFIKMKHHSYQQEQEQQRWEYKIYKSLQQTKGMLRTPKCYFHSPLMSCYEALVLELLGPSLYDMWHRCGQRFSIRALAQIAYQLICLMKYFHERGLVYQNIRPEHFLYGPTGLERWSWMYAIDLKCCKFWCRSNGDGQTEHIPFSRAKPGADGSPVQGLGTPIRYQSINAHEGIEQTRRDDLESIGYLLVYLFKGHLPWIHLERIENIQKRNEQILNLKLKSLENGTLFQNMLPEFERYMKMVRMLNYDQEPDYQCLARLFQDVQRLIGYANIYQLYDWDGFHKPIR